MQQIEARKPAISGPTRVAGAFSRIRCLDVDEASGILLEPCRAVVAAGHVYAGCELGARAPGIGLEDDSADRAARKLAVTDTGLRAEIGFAIRDLGGT